MRAERKRVSDDLAQRAADVVALQRAHVAQDRVGQTETKSRRSKWGPLAPGVHSKAAVMGPGCDQPASRLTISITVFLERPRLRPMRRYERPCLCCASTFFAFLSDGR